MISLVKMNEIEFNDYLKVWIVEYADDKVKAGQWHKDEALEKSKDAYNELLPYGVNTHKNYIYVLKNTLSSESIGVLWFAIKEINTKEFMFVYEIEIKSEHRNKGYATQAFKELEKIAKKINISDIKLHVFGDNKIAQGLYKKIGYKVTSINMHKVL